MSQWELKSAAQSVLEGRGYDLIPDSSPALKRFAWINWVARKHQSDDDTNWHDENATKSNDDGFGRSEGCRLMSLARTNCFHSASNWLLKSSLIGSAVLVVTKNTQRWASTWSSIFQGKDLWTDGQRMANWTIHCRLGWACEGESAVQIVSPRRTIQLVNHRLPVGSLNWVGNNKWHCFVRDCLFGELQTKGEGADSGSPDWRTEAHLSTKNSL